jgi:virginiamycin B lyase
LVHRSRRQQDRPPFDRDGVITEFPISTPIVAGGLGPIGIAGASDGNIWFCEYSASRIGRLNIATGVITELNTPTANSGPNEIVAGPVGNLWFIEQISNSIGRISP